jgi:8-amino-7-oxononanoate synthase
VPHHDADAFDTRLRQWRKACGHGRAWIAVESLYSMDGDSPDLTDLLAVASRHDAILVIDEAHATGVLRTRPCGAVRGPRQCHHATYLQQGA